MTPKQFREWLNEFHKEVGSRADVSVWINSGSFSDGRPALNASVYPNGITKGEGYFSVEADEFKALSIKLKAEWDKNNEKFRVDLIRKMALKIIRMTDEVGQCTDAALRLEFGESDVKRLGALACAKADEMAARGPFTITNTTPNSNHAPTDEATHPAV